MLNLDKYLTKDEILFIKAEAENSLNTMKGSFATSKEVNSFINYINNLISVYNIFADKFYKYKGCFYINFKITVNGLVYNSKLKLYS